MSFKPGRPFNPGKTNQVTGDREALSNEQEKRVMKQRDSELSNLLSQKEVIQNQQDQIQDLHTQIAERDGAAEVNQTALTMMSSKLLRAQEQLNSLQAQLAARSQSEARMQLRQAELETELSEAHATVETVQTRMRSLCTQLGAHEDAEKLLREQLSALQKQQASATHLAAAESSGQFQEELETSNAIRAPLEKQLLDASMWVNRALGDGKSPHRILAEQDSRSVSPRSVSKSQVTAVETGAQLSLCRKEVEELQAQVSQAAVERESLTTSLKQQLQLNHQKHASQLGVESQLAESNRRIESMVSLAATQETKTKLAGLLNEANQTIALLREQVAGAERTQETLEGAHETVALLKKQLAASEDTRVEYEQLVRESLQQTASLEEQLSRSHEGLASSASQLSEAEDATAVTQKELDEEKANRALVDWELERMHQSAAALKDQRMAEQLSAASELDCVEAKVREAQGQMKEYQKTIELLQHKLSAAECDDAGTQQVAESLMGRITEGEQENKGLSYTVGAMREQLAAMVQSGMEAEQAGVQRAGEWEKRESELVKQEEELRELLGTAKQMIVSLKHQLGAEQEVVAGMREEMGQLQAHERALQSELETVLGEQPQAVTVQRLLESQIIKLNDTIATLSQELEVSEENELILEKREKMLQQKLDFMVRCSPMIADDDALGL